MWQNELKKEKTISKIWKQRDRNLNRLINKWLTRLSPPPLEDSQSFNPKTCNRKLGFFLPLPHPRQKVKRESTLFLNNLNHRGIGSALLVFFSGGRKNVSVSLSKLHFCTDIWWKVCRIMERKEDWVSWIEFFCRFTLPRESFLWFF